MMMKRLYSILLAVMLVCSLFASASADEVQAGTFYERTADPETLSRWQTIFGPDVLNTDHVGTVWTDKSVTEDRPDTTKYPEYSSITKSGDADFMVSLSAISATKSITGHETLPTDTVFVLDLSSSMYRFGADHYYDDRVVSKMVNAVNGAIHTLLNLNPYNRVGVVVYYGASTLHPQSNSAHGTKVLPLDRYPTLDDTGNPDVHPSYLVLEYGTASYSIEQSDKTYKYYTEEKAFVGITVNSQLNADYTAYVMPGNRGNDNIAGTYAQLGIELAREMFLDIEDTTVPADAGFQAGATRIPIMVLMSDGEPTAAAASFADVGTADMGNNTVGERSAAETDFLTQLTAAYTRKQIDEHYVATKPLFYTLGLETSSISYDVMDPRNTDQEHAGKTNLPAYIHRTKRASASDDVVNDPAVVNHQINSYWDTLLNNGSVNIQALVNTTGGVADSAWSVKPFTISKYEGFPSSIEDKYYVDRYFPAEDADALDDAFGNIVQEIYLQSAYYPTYVENGAIGMSGYLEFHDEIGDMLEVKKVHGLVREATANEKTKYKIDYFMYTGKQLAEHIADCRNDSTALAELKVVLGKLLQARFKLTNETTLQNAITAIINPDNKMFYYVSDSDYGNVIRWYADENEQYIGLNLGGTAPSGAVFAMESYWYADTTSPEAMENYNSILRVKTNLETGKQCVTWSVPASMIPLVTYKIAVNANSLDKATQITMDCVSNNPIRAVFDVGLRDEINRYNAVAYLKEAGYTPNSDGSYTFYSNQWQVNSNGNIPVQPSTDRDTASDLANFNVDEVNNSLSYFRPSEQNERYNVTEATPLYNADGTPWTGSGDKYIKHITFTRDKDEPWNKDGNAELTAALEKVTANSANIKEIDGKYYVLEGTVDHAHHQAIAKESNPTGTYQNSFYETTCDEDNVSSILGNNGMFSFVPDTGIIVTKKLSTGTTTDNFTFVIAPTAGSGIKLADKYDVYYLDAGATDVASYFETRAATSVSTVNNTLTVSIAPGQMAYIAGLPTGSYTVSEQAFDGSDHTYVVSNVEVGGVVRDPSAEATVTVENCKMVELEYTNTRVNSGSIAITKAVNGNPPSDSTFTFEVNLGSARAGKVFTKKIGTATSSVTADADGKLTVSIKAGEKATISGIPANTSVTVTETNLPAGYTVDGQAALTKTVTEGDTVTFNYTNNYNAADTSVTFSGTKTLDGRDLTTNDKFTFELYETDSTYSITGKTAIQTTQNGANGAYTFTKIDYTAPGTHYYVVKESAGSISGVTYDGTVYEIQVVVTDNNAKLEATVTGATANALNFTNTYTPAGTSVTLSGEKALEGRDLANGEFTFELYEVAGADAAVVVGAKPTQTATNGADGAYTFAKIDYTTPGTHYYVVKESIPADKQGVTYDTTEYRVTVDVTDNKNGQLETTVTTNNKNSLDFTNTYQAADGSITLSGTKTLTGRTLKDGEFSFTLTETESDFTTPVTGGTTETVTNVNGAFTFGAITYTAPGTHYYTVAENAGTLGGVTYDTTLYRVTVTVTDNGLGQLITAATYAKVNGETTSAAEGMAFANTYTAAKGSITLSGTKAISGYRELKADEFTFELYAADANYAITDTNPLRTATNAAETGAYAFEAIEYTTPDTYYYVVKEQAGSLNGMTYDTTEYHVAVTVVDNLSGALVATAAVTTPANLAPETAPTGTTLNFTNSYDAEDVTVPVGGAKTLTGRDLQNGEFEFVLYQANSDFATDGNALQTVKNGADGKFTFTDLSFSQPGTYYYVVQEKSTGLAGVTYDTTVYQITVVVTDDPDNAKLVANATVTVNKAATDKTPATLTFVNAYDAEDISVVLSGAKTLVGRPLGNEEFSFTLYAADESFTAGTAIETVQNNGANFSFTALEYEKAGTYYYVVKEDAGTLPGVTYDETVYHVTVTVTDNASSGKLEVVSKVEKASAEAAVAALALVEVPVSGLDFTNTYKAKSVSVPLSATKTLTGRNLLADEFTFKLVNPANGNTIIARNAADGSISLGNLAFTEAGTYTYTLSEVLPAEADRLPSVAYDAAVYTVTIVVTDNYAEGKLESDVTYSKDGASVEALTFTNVYDAESVPVVISATKTLTGRDLLEGEFSFKLVNPANGNTLLARNAADGSISFGTLMFTKAGTYNFTLEEIIPADADKLPGVAYDPTVYNITVVVTDNTETGKLVATTTYAKADGTPVEALTFNNTYNADAVPMSITATKVLTGRDLLEGEFSFKLVNPANGNTLLARNAADGSIAFGTLMFTKAGTYTYTLEEVMPEEPLPGVAYDPTVYTVTIEVTDNTLTGKLEAQVTFTAPDSTDPAEPVFTNVYDADSVIVPLSATKELTGLTLKEGDFSFALTNTDRNNVIVSRNKADGSISFGSLMFGNAGTYHFTLAEIKPEDALPGVIYDDRVYDVTIVVTDNTVTGKLEAETTFTLDGEEVEALTFSNQYVPSSVSVRLSGVKHLQGAELAEGMFTFQLYAADSRFTPVGAPVTAVNTADGSFSFASRTFTQAGVYHYVVMEDGSDPLPSITYDPTVYHVTITVRDTGAGYLTATTRIATSDGATVSEMAFENIFFEAPDTGDHTTLNTYLALCLVSLTGLMALVLRRKRA